jgi:ADP-ribose pyrophosphatase YjhB (NUDIX family)
MTMLGTNIAIIQSSQVLLAKREDFEVWSLPGGMVDPGESVAQAAIRETREETGLRIELLRLVGVYSRLGGAGPDIHGALFVAQPIGGNLTPQPDEVLELRYFAPDALPELIVWWHKLMVADAVGDVNRSIARMIKLAPPEVVHSRQELYNLRDHSGLSRSAFYKYYFEQPDTGATSLEVGGA